MGLCNRKTIKSLYVCYDDVLLYERIKNRINEYRKEKGLGKVKEYEIFRVMLDLFIKYGVRKFADINESL